METWLQWLQALREGVVETAAVVMKAAEMVAEKVQQVARTVEEEVQSVRDQGAREHQRLNADIVKVDCCSFWSRATLRIFVKFICFDDGVATCS